MNHSMLNQLINISIIYLISATNGLWHLISMALVYVWMSHISFKLNC